MQENILNIRSKNCLEPTVKDLHLQQVGVPPVHVLFQKNTTTSSESPAVVNSRATLSASKYWEQLSETLSLLESDHSHIRGKMKG